ncbi:MAG: CerR family C-terminal domain-containing protein [Rubrivivax sp.]|jgi:AcrR family transcriptional regulator|nr:CerR family C-terminal domain-containing protein [Rubrivivax sp.]
MNAKAISSPSSTVPGTVAEDTRQRLLNAALRLFAEQGFAKTSTRELAEAAQVNIAAISYHFGDKAGLYRAVYFEPMGSPEADITLFREAAHSLESALTALYASFLEPLRQGDASRLCMKLHFREWIEPTGLWDEELRTSIQPMHDVLVGVLVRSFGLPAPDDDVQRLAVLLVAPGVHLHIGRDVTDLVAPGLYDGPDAINLWCERMLTFGMAMVHAEARRRGVALRDDG